MVPDSDSQLPFHYFRRMLCATFHLLLLDSWPLSDCSSSAAPARMTLVLLALQLLLPQQAQPQRLNTVIMETTLRKEITETMVITPSTEGAMRWRR